MNVSDLSLHYTPIAARCRQSACICIDITLSAMLNIRLRCDSFK